MGNKLKLKFEDRGRDCHVAFLSHPTGHLQAIRVVLCGKVWRVDTTTSVASAWPPWEPLLERDFDDFPSAVEACEAHLRLRYWV